MRERRVAAVLVVAMSAAVTLEWSRTFETGPPVLAVAALAAGVVALAWTVGADAPRPLAASIGMSLVGLAVLLAAVGLRPMGVIEALVHGWSELLTTSLPTPRTPELLATPIVVTWVTTMVGAESVLRLRRPLLGILPPLVAYAVGLVFAAGTDGVGLPLALAVTTFGLVVAASSRLERARGPGAVGTAGAGERSSRGRRLVGVLAMLVPSALVGVLLGPTLPFADAREDFDPRVYQRPPVDELAVIDPMSMLAGWARGADDDKPLFTVRAPGAEDFQRWTWAVLDRYDPASGWSTSARLVPAAGELPATGPLGTDTTPLSQSFTIGGLEGPWLPAATRAVEVDGVAPLVDPTSGVLARREGLDRGLRYDVRSEVPTRAPDCSLAPAATLGEADIDSAIPDEVAELARLITAEATSPCERAELLEQYLTSEPFTYSREAFSGSALRNVRTLLDFEGEDDARTAPPFVGTAEQFATTYALMVRAVGLPARVVVGFRAGGRTGDLLRVRPVDAHAWVEVGFQDLGWVPFDPTPRPGDQPPAPELPEEEAQDDGSTADQTVGAGPVESEDPNEGAAVGDADGGRSVVATVAFGLAAMVGAVVLLAAVLAMTRRRKTRRRRRGPTDSQRVIGAWRECLDALRDVGVHPATSDSAADVVGRSALVLPGAEASLIPVATLVNGVLFSSDELDARAADEAWEHADRLRELASRSTSRKARARRALDVRVLVRS
jgi:transglutaminase-like putative cysteine protease